MADVSTIINDVPVPGASIIASAVSFLSSFIKGKTTHATFSQVSPGSNNWAAAVESQFNTTFATNENLLIAQYATPLLLQAMQTKWGLAAQGQPSLAQSISNRVPSIRELAATLYTWVNMNVDAASADEVTIDMKWGWQYVFVTAMQQAGIDSARLIATEPNLKQPTAGAGAAVAGIGGSALVLIIAVAAILFAIVRKKGHG